MSDDKVLYSIPRVKTLNKQSVVKACSHNKRNIEVANADGSKRLVHLPVKTDGEVSDLSYLDLIKEILEPFKLPTERKKAIMAVELVLTASPQFFSKDKTQLFDIDSNCDQLKFDEWKSRTLDWVRKKFADKIIAITLHLDESTPHLHVLFVPLVTKKVRASHAYQKTRLEKQVRLCGSDLVRKKWLYELHDDYNKSIQCLGLTRGKLHSQAKHHPIKENRNLELENENLRAEAALLAEQCKAMQDELKINLEAKKENEQLRKERDLLLKQQDSMLAELKLHRGLTTKVEQLKLEASTCERKSIEARDKMVKYTHALSKIMGKARKVSKNHNGLTDAVEKKKNEISLAENELESLLRRKNKVSAELVLKSKSIAECEPTLRRLNNEIINKQKVLVNARVVADESMNAIRPQLELINSTTLNSEKLLSLVDGFSEFIGKEQLPKDICKLFETVLDEMKSNLHVFLEHNKSINAQKDPNLVLPISNAKNSNSPKLSNTLNSSLPPKKTR